MASPTFLGVVKVAGSFYFFYYFFFPLEHRLVFHHFGALLAQDGLARILFLWAISQ
jgi:hypothetical protein